jgi:hypothetical protein
MYRWGTKNAEFYAVLRTAEKVATSSATKSKEAKTFMHNNKRGKSLYFQLFSAAHFLD